MNWQPPDLVVQKKARYRGLFRSFFIDTALSTCLLWIGGVSAIAWSTRA
jgi:hypothetical protein